MNCYQSLIVGDVGVWRHDVHCDQKEISLWFEVVNLFDEVLGFLDIQVSEST